MSGDFENWNTEPSHHKAPDEIARKYEARDERRGQIWLTVKILLILAGCAVGVWWGMHGK